MAKLSDLSELHLAALIAGATALGGVLSSAADALWSDASTDKATNVQLVQLAIGILGEEDQDQDRSRDRVLRSWAVETINAAADVKFDQDAQRLLINGEASLSSWIKAYKLSRGSAETQIYLDTLRALALGQSKDDAGKTEKLLEPELPKSVPQKE